MEAAHQSVFDCAWNGVSNTVCFVTDGCETGRKKVVGFLTQALPDQYARIADRISQTVPEVFVGICYIAGLWTIPAFFISWARKAIPLLPIIKSLVSPEIDTNELAKRLEECLTNFGRMFDKVIVPALFVCLTVDAIFSFSMGWLTQDWHMLLHGTVIALPGAFLAFKYMWDQVAKEIEDEKEKETTKEIEDDPSMDTPDSEGVKSGKSSS